MEFFLTQFTLSTAEELFHFLQLYRVFARSWLVGLTVFYKMDNDFSEILKLISSPSLIELKDVLQDILESEKWSRRHLSYPGNLCLHLRDIPALRQYSKML
jgi:hypothetical protein